MKIENHFHRLLKRVIQAKPKAKKRNEVCRCVGCYNARQTGPDNSATAHAK